MITVLLNGERRDVDEGTAVGTLVAAAGLGQPPFVVAVNDVVVPAAELPRHPVAAADRIEVLTVRQGG